MAKGVNLKPMSFPNSRVSKATAFGAKSVKRFPSKPASGGSGRASK